MKNVYILVGGRGSGKTYIGKLIKKELRIKFLLVEPYFLDVADSKDYKNLNDKLFAKVWEKIGVDIEDYLKNNDKIIFESLGIFSSFKNFLLDLKKKYNVKLVKINTPQEVCISRLKGRDSSLHVKIGKDTIKKINKSVEKEKYNFDLNINNENLSNKKIVEKFKSIL